MAVSFITNTSTLNVLLSTYNANQTTNNIATSADSLSSLLSALSAASSLKQYETTQNA